MSGSWAVHCWEGMVREGSWESGFWADPQKMGRSQPWKERVDRRKLKVVVTRWITDYTVVVQLISRAQLFCDPKDCSPPGSSVRGISQARTLEWAAVSFSRGSSQPRNRTQVSCIGGRRFNLWATREAHRVSEHKIPSQSRRPPWYRNFLIFQRLATPLYPPSNMTTYFLLTSIFLI